MEPRSHTSPPFGATILGDRVVVGVRLHGELAEVELEPARAVGELGALGGSALCFELVRTAEAGRLALTIGAATWRGVPGAGRVHVGGRSPLTGGYTEGAVGGRLAWALAAADVAGITVEGRAGAASVLVIEAGEAGPVARLEPVAALIEGGADAADALGAQGWARHLMRWAEQGADQAGVLVCGPGARRGVPYGLLVTGDEVGSATGRGGLGTLLAERGCWAIVVRVCNVAARPGGEPGEGWLARAAAASPRLKARARSGTLELFAAFAARGDVGPELAGWGRAARAAEAGHHGCKGCPTPCGMVFERGGARGGARFGAAHALGAELGIADFEDVLEVLAACDHAGVDAREAAGVLALLRALDADARAELVRTCEDAAAVLEVLPPQGVALDLDGLVAALACLPRLGLEALGARTGRAVITAGGQAARRERDLAANLGQLVATAGNDPLRAFPFTVARAAESAVAPKTADWSPLAGVAPGVLDPLRPDGKGRLVAWHEDLAAAVDIAGFCSFSTAGLLVDEALTLDELAALVAPAPLAQDAQPGRAWLAAGRALVLARRALAAELRGPQELPDWARPELAHPEALGAYLVVRGEAERALELGLLEPAGSAVSRAATAARDASGVDAAAVADAEAGGTEAGPGAAFGAVAKAPAADGRRGVFLRVSGALEDALVAGGLALVGGALEVPLPADGCTLTELCRSLAERHPRARGLLFTPSGRLLPSVWRAGALVGGDGRVAPGDVLDVVLVIGGG